MSMSMSAGQPKPKVALNNICSVIYNNTLYTYSADAFQSLSLEQGSEWKTLKQGEEVSGAACVGSSSAFYVVGGTGGSSDYQGLQRYTYSTGTWESIDPVVPVTQNRTDHGAVYLEGSDSIVVYAGSQAGDPNLSTQTFSISATAPYSVLAYQNEGAPPTSKPILLRWSDQQAAMVGGSATNTQVMLFTVGSGWSNSGATLASPLKTGSDQWQAVLITGDDGSKNLYTFDMSVSPNVANRTVLIDEHGAPVTKAAAITKRSDVYKRTGKDEVERRANTLTQETWPTYNSTYASTAVRSNYAAADSDDGQVVLSGGNEEDVLCIFNAKANSWVNATELLASDQKVLSASTSSSSSSATATSTTASGTLFATLNPTTTPETTAAAGSTTTSSTHSSSTTSSSSGLGTNGILGVVLGSIGGALVLLILLYCQIRKRKRTQDFIQAGHARRASGASERPEKEGMAIVTESYPRSPTNPTFMRGHQPKASTGSFSSMAILMGKGPKSSMEGGPRPGSSKQMKNVPTAGQMGPMRPVPALAPELREEKGVSFAADTAEPRPGLRVPADQQDGMRRSSGWNRYWSGDSAALNILGYGNGGQQTNRNTVASEGSHYSNNGPGVDPRYRMTKDSATVPPLNVDDGRPRFNRVNSGSPTVSNYPAAVKQHMSAEYSDRNSRDSDFSGYSSGIPASVHDTWDPTAASGKPWTGGGRATSSMYSNAFPMPPTPSEQRPPMPRNIPSGVSQQPQLDKAHTSDMSWLNIGEQQHQQNRY
ncbi:pre-mRNA splicing factor CLF1 [Diaporthe amygdali]|uniref:pre-mRNA splicing factor CLF1 n=1 Tax=Phomopsis amygdali TaxID=1214568 RepID=UPI0022FEDF6E|nr:pre-mRNA splicing factor CLF1 [Diaporthe amygdali]KAJ0121697.1 pre-mRNA splicing factor CLF1 [Diaporthe amygdali]